MGGIKPGTTLRERLLTYLFLIVGSVLLMALVVWGLMTFGWWLSRDRPARRWLARGSRPRGHPPATSCAISGRRQPNVRRSSPDCMSAARTSE
jgi:hypothetical protein